MGLWPGPFGPAALRRLCACPNPQAIRLQVGQHQCSLVWIPKPRFEAAVAAHVELNIGSPEVMRFVAFIGGHALILTNSVIREEIRIANAVALRHAHHNRFQKIIHQSRDVFESH